MSNVNDVFKVMTKQVGTRIEEDVFSRLEKLAAHDLTTPAAIVRKCVVRYLPQLETEVLGSTRGPVREEEVAP